MLMARERTLESFTVKCRYKDIPSKINIIYRVMQGYSYSTVIEENLYPSSGYLLETGGKLKNLRTSTSNSKIKHYHEHFYRPDNLVLIITGNIKSQDIFYALHKIEDKIVETRKNKTESLFSRPWKTYLPSLDLKEDLIKEIPYDSDYKNEGSATL